MLLLNVVSICIPAMENCLAEFTLELKSTVLLLYMFSHVVLLVPGIVTLSTLPQPLASNIHTLVHLAGHHGLHG